MYKCREFLLKSTVKKALSENMEQLLREVFNGTCLGVTLQTFWHQRFLLASCFQGAKKTLAYPKKVFFQNQKFDGNIFADECDNKFVTTPQKLVTKSGPNILKILKQHSLPRSVHPESLTFCHFGKKIKVFGKFLRVNLVFGKILNLPRYDIG